MANKNVNKVVVNGTTVLDLSADSATAENVKKGKTFHDKSGTKCEGTLIISSPVIQPLSVTENGTYTVPNGVDGYSPVTVNVPSGGAIMTTTGCVTPTSDVGRLTIHHGLGYVPTIFTIHVLHFKSSVATQVLCHYMYNSDETTAYMLVYKTSAYASNEAANLMPVSVTDQDITIDASAYGTSYKFRSAYTYRWFASTE